MKRTEHWRRVLELVVLASFGWGALPGGEAAEREGVQLFYRMLGAQTSRPLLPKTRTICGQDGAEWAGQTGMADSGFTEYPFCAGRMSYTFQEQYAYFPRIASGVPIDPAGVNVGDILIDHVYEPDPVVWGLRGREFVQTFVARGRELASLTFMVASEVAGFRAALVEGGPGGSQIGQAKSFRSGSSLEWGYVRWWPGEAPLQPGRTYGIRLWREDGQPWAPYLHATGNCYDDGQLHVDGQPRPESDLGAWIIEEPPELSRALMPEADANNYVYNSAGFVFVPRTPNVRLITVTASPLPFQCGDVFLNVWTDEDPARLLAGPKRNLACGPENGPHTAHFLFAADELKVEPGRRYRAGWVGWVEHKGGAPVGLASAAPQVLDMQAVVYGEPHPGGLPAIHNVQATFPVTNRIMRLSWTTSYPCPVKVEIKRLSPGETAVYELAAGVSELEIPQLWPGHVYDFRLEAAGVAGLTWRTPLYHLQIPQGPHPLIEPAYPEQPDFFIPIVPPTLPAAPVNRPFRYRALVPLVNGDFEEGLSGWTVSPPGIIYAAAEEHGISPGSGKRMAGWTHRSETSREQVFEESVLHQRVPTQPGHTYVVSVRALTSVANHAPRGDTRVRLWADPRGGTDWGGANASQWYWTDGRWFRLEHRWVAQADQSTVGLGFFRWRDWEGASAYVDRVMVFDLGPSPAQRDDPPPGMSEVPRWVLADRRVEFDERVEAELSVPSGYVVTGLGARAHEDNLTTLWMQIRPLQPDGTLGVVEQIRGGWEPDAGLEAEITLPDGYVATGFGGRIAPEWDVRTLALWGRPLLSDGTLGEEKQFRGGIEPEGGLEREMRVLPGRVLTTAGMNCGFNNVNRIKAASMALVPSSTGRAQSGSER